MALTVPDFFPIPEFDAVNRPDFHAHVTIQFGELYTDGVIDFNDASWDFPRYSDEQHARLCAKIVDRYFWREIGSLPVLRWKTEFLRKLKEIMPKYIPIYKMLDDGADIMAVSDGYGKRREIRSDYPITMLGDNQDYASEGVDSEYEDINTGDFMTQAERLKDYDDVDVMILNELDVCFTCILYPSVNGM